MKADISDRDTLRGGAVGALLCSMPVSLTCCAVTAASGQSRQGRCCSPERLGTPGQSDLILGTFLLRHSILLSRGTGLTLVGSRFDAETRRLLEVLARNRLVWTWLDLETAARDDQPSCLINGCTNTMLMARLKEDAADLRPASSPG